jgi:hypothetical protein
VRFFIAIDGVQGKAIAMAELGSGIGRNRTKSGAFGVFCWVGANLLAFYPWVFPF